MSETITSPLDWLFGLEFHGIKLGLDNIRALMRAAGDPHLRYPTVHVAGTNGKGSVIAFLDAMFQAAGYRTGRFTSPHLIDFRERVLVDRVPMSTENLDVQINFFREAAADWDHSPTFFEINTAIAFRHFAEANVDMALIEVGMGGRFDATNVVQPCATAITTVGLEHTQYLGDTLGAIAFEKAGIIKPGVPVVVGEQLAESLDVIKDRADECDAPVYLIKRDFDYRVDNKSPTPQFYYGGEQHGFGPVPLALQGTYQGANAAVACGLAEVLLPHFLKLQEGAVVAGLDSARWPCRLEQVLDDPPVIVDVSHNPLGVKALIESVEQKCVVVLAVAKDKDAAAMVQALGSVPDPLIVTHFEGDRAMSPESLAEAAGEMPHVVAESLDAAISRGYAMASAQRPLLITGSFFTAGQARQILVDRYGARPIAF
jgi:dihydrofolate synthase / folylpolyglutamate synthase